MDTETLTCRHVFTEDARLVIRPMLSTHPNVDVTECLITAIQNLLDTRVGGNGILNRLEAEQAVEEIVAHMPH